MSKGKQELDNKRPHRRNRYLRSSGVKGKFAAYRNESVKALNKGPFRWR